MRKAWNKGLTKTDLRVKAYCDSEGNKANRFKSGKRPERLNEKNPHWKGGIHINNGYVFRRKPNHPKAVNGYVMEHRLIMEKSIGRYLEDKEIVHHKNGNIKDNRIENLAVMTLGEHTRFHNLNRKLR